MQECEQRNDLSVHQRSGAHICNICNIWLFRFREPEISFDGHVLDSLADLL